MIVIDGPYVRKAILKLQTFLEIYFYIPDWYNVVLFTSKKEKKLVAKDYLIENLSKMLLFVIGIYYTLKSFYF